MSNAKLGYESYVGFGNEASFGTAIAPSSFVEFNSEGFKKEKEERLITALNGSPQYSKRVTLAENVSGSLEFPVVPNSLLKALYSCSAGNGYSVVTGTGIFTHTFVFDKVATLPSMTFQVARDINDTSTVYNYTGCRVNSAGFNVAVNDLLNCTLDVMGVQEALANTISTASFSSFNPYTFAQATVAIGSTAGDATTTCVDSWSLNIANNLIEDRCLGSVLRSNIEKGMQDITYEINMRYQDNTMYNRFLNGTKTYVKAVFTGASITALANHSVTFESFNCYANGTTPNIGGADIIKHSIPFRAIREDSSVGTLKVTVVTSQATL